MDISKIVRVMTGIAAIGAGIYTLGGMLFSGEIDTSALLLCTFFCCLCASTVLFGRDRSGDDADREHRPSPSEIPS